MQITEIGYACGLGNASYFGKLFREFTGYTPLQYRRKWQNTNKKSDRIKILSVFHRRYNNIYRQQAVFGQTFLSERNITLELNCQTAEAELTWAEKQNPGAWAEHSRFVALACKNIAAQCKDLSSDRAYCFGLLHDIGRYAGVTSERHLIDGYRFCMEKGWNKAAQICISHAFMIQDIKTSIGTFDVSEDDYMFMERFISHAVYDDYDRLVQLCDALALPTGFCLLEKKIC